MPSDPESLFDPIFSTDEVVVDQRPKQLDEEAFGHALGLGDGMRRDQLLGVLLLGHVDDGVHRIGARTRELHGSLTSAES